MTYTRTNIRYLGSRAMGFEPNLLFKSRSDCPKMVPYCPLGLIWTFATNWWHCVNCVCASMRTMQFIRVVFHFSLSIFHIYTYEKCAFVCLWTPMRVEILWSANATHVVTVLYNIRGIVQRALSLSLAFSSSNACVCVCKNVRSAGCTHILALPSASHSPHTRTQTCMHGTRTASHHQFEAFSIQKWRWKKTITPHEIYVIKHEQMALVARANTDYKK